MDCKGRIIPAATILWRYSSTLQMRKQDVIDNTGTRKCENDLETLDPDYIQCIQNSVSFLIDLWQTQEPLENVHIEKSLWSEEWKSLSFENRENNSELSISWKINPSSWTGQGHGDWPVLSQTAAAQRGEREEGVIPAKSLQGALEGARRGKPGTCLAASQAKREPASDAREQWMGTTEKANKSARPWSSTSECQVCLLPMKRVATEFIEHRVWSC